MRKRLRVTEERDQQAESPLHHQTARRVRTRSGT